MSQSLEVSCRVDFRPLAARVFCEHLGRLESVSARGCIIRTPHHPESWTELELRIYLPGSGWPLRVDRAKVTAGHGDSFTVDFLNLSAGEQERLRNYLREYLEQPERQSPSWSEPPMLMAVAGV